MEILAIIKALKKFRVYLLGIPFKIITDCKTFAVTMKKKNTCLRIARWTLLIEEFQYVIEHSSEKLMRYDALSRKPVKILFLETDQRLIKRIQTEQRKNPEIKKILYRVCC